MKAAKNVDKNKDKNPVTPRSRTRQIYRDTIKVEKDKIYDIRHSGMEPWRKEELIKPIQKRVDNFTSSRDEFNKSEIEKRRAYEASRPTPTFKGGGKMKSIKKYAGGGEVPGDDKKNKRTARRERRSSNEPVNFPGATSNKQKKDQHSGVSQPMVCEADPSSKSNAPKCRTSRGRKKSMKAFLKSSGLLKGRIVKSKPEPEAKKTPVKTVQNPRFMGPPADIQRGKKN